MREQELLDDIEEAEALVKRYQAGINASALLVALGVVSICVGSFMNTEGLPVALGVLGSIAVITFSVIGTVWWYLNNSKKGGYERSYSHSANPHVQLREARKRYGQYVARENS